jgi:DNA-binding transcriptional MocR family regulator
MKESIRERLGIGAQVYFAVVPEWVLDLPISAQAVRVYCCLRRYADNKTGECWPSRRTLAMRSRTSITTLDRCLKELVDHGAIRMERRKGDNGDWTSNLYTVLSMPLGVASDLVPPRPVLAATGSSKSDALTKPNVNDRQELPKYDFKTQAEQEPPTADGLLLLAAEFEELADTNKQMAPALKRLAAKFVKQAEELSNE